MYQGNINVPFIQNTKAQRHYVFFKLNKNRMEYFVLQAGIQLFSVDYSAITKNDDDEMETFTVENLLGYGEKQRKSIIV